MSRWYMRDNHTFRKLPECPTKALAVVREEFENGETYGMLCSKEEGINTVEHAHKDWAEFEPRAIAWLRKVAEPSPGEVEYRSWIMSTPTTKEQGS